MTRFFGAFLAVLLCTTSLRAQAAECEFTSLGRTAGTEEGGVEIIHFYDPFVVVCTDGAELRANSGRLNRGIGELYLVGNVLFQDTARTLTSNEATYDSATARLWATGDVVFVDRGDGSTIRGPELEYLRATPERPLAQMTATRRPTVTIPAGADADPSDPLEIVGDRVVVVGDDDLSAFGDVVITRPDLHATSGEARYNSAAESLELRERAIIRSDEYELRGEVVQARLVDGGLEHVHSRTAASLRGEDLAVTAPELQLFFADDQLQRAVAQAGDGDLAEAVSGSFRIRADSLDATLVNQRLEQVDAVGRAIAETFDTTAVMAAAPADTALAAGPPDTTLAAAPADTALAAGPPDAASAPAASDRSEVLRHDWIRGDTVVGYFEPVVAAGESPPLAEAIESPPDADEDRPADRSVELRRLHARGSAQSLYRLQGEHDPPGERRNINFLVGEQIELELIDGQLEVAQVLGLQQGLYLEADAPGPGAPPEGALPPVEEETSEPAPPEPGLPPAGPA